MDYRSPYDVLREYWGYDTFRIRQEHIIKSVLDGHDTLALLPTGGGKSICYQVPALCKKGICLVFSPLISLMNDQVQQLKKKGIEAELLHSGLSNREVERILDNCSYGQTKLLYISPERLSSEKALARLIRMNINLIAVDEAHCISQWGYDFRPSYLEIARIRAWMPGVPILALTATATEEVVDDI
ncbi:MAG: RecQ family ATP-dependent DNA helicase, partial [Saprospiraceae bacterium]